jgi:hypothetical protein
LEELGPGNEIALRETWRGRVWRVFPNRIVERDGDDFVLWSPAGTPVLRPFDAGETQLRVPGDADWRLVPRPSSHDSLGLVRLGRRWSLWLHWEDGRFVYWYVNLERDHRLRGAVLDYVDEKLDLVVRADGSVHWKDEDELAQAAASGYLDEAEVRAEAARVLADPPWPTGREEWRADPAWPAPRLPPGWDLVS